MPTVRLEDRALIRVTGEDAGTFLHGLVTTDISGLPQSLARPGALLTPQGKILFDFLVFRAESGFFLDTRAETANDLAKRLKLFRMRAKAEISEPEQSIVAVGWDGDSAASRDESGRVVDGRFDVAVTRSFGATAEAANAPRTLWDALRIVHGVAELGPDYPASDAFPHDVNFDQTGGVSFRKGCYVGQEVVSRMQHRGTARKRVLIASGANVLEPGVDIFAGGRVCGRLGTAAGSEALAIARLDRVKAAMDAGAAITAGGVDIALTLPPGVTFGWPDAASAGEE